MSCRWCGDALLHFPFPSHPPSHFSLALLTLFAAFSPITLTSFLLHHSLSSLPPHFLCISFPHHYHHSSFITSPLFKHTSTHLHRFRNNYLPHHCYYLSFTNITTPQRTTPPSPPSPRQCDNAFMVSLLAGSARVMNASYQSPCLNGNRLFSGV